MISVTDCRPKALSAFDSLRVAIPSASEVLAYLDEHADLFEPVESVCRATRNEFGADADLTLSLYRDSEANDQHLLLRLRMKSYPADTMRRIQSVSDSLESVLWDKSGSILVTTDFRRLG